MLMKNLSEFRKFLHSHPELSGNENNTKDAVLRFISEFSKGKPIFSIYKNIGENSLALIIDSNNSGKNVVIRADLDALPIDENIFSPYSSTIKGVSHKCGHDGHTAILTGLALELSENLINIGKVMLLFQSAEETGEGAEKVLEDKVFIDFNPDFIFGFHNLPEKPLNKLYFKYDTFAMASTGLIIKLIGKSSHAAEPEKGINPAVAISELIKGIDKIKNNNTINDFALITFIHINLGEKSFGTSAGSANLMLTLRANTDEYLEKILKKINSITTSICKKNNLGFELELTETFPSTVNNHLAVEMLINNADNNMFDYEILDSPFRWSEDFGHYLKNIPGAYFGIGAGENCPPLHSPDYDFPDEIIDNSVKYLKTLVLSVCR